MISQQDDGIMIISGGQTGADQAALQAAMDLGIAVGGWCPAGRRTECGPLSTRFPLRETPSSTYEERTEWNVRDAELTLIFSPKPLTGGTKLTVSLARRLKRPCFVYEMHGLMQEDLALEWLRSHPWQRLNVAGPRESTCPGIYQFTYEHLRRLLQRYQRLLAMDPSCHVTSETSCNQDSL